MILNMNSLLLSEAKVGAILSVSRLIGPAANRLRDLGLKEKARLRKLSNGNRLICSVYGARIALSAELAKQISVIPLSS